VRIRGKRDLGVSPAFPPCIALSARILLQQLPCPRNTLISIPFLPVGIVRTKESKDESKSACGELVHISMGNIGWFLDTEKSAVPCKHLTRKVPHLNNLYKDET